MAKWNESEHPRDDDGKFTDGTGGGRTQWITSKRDFSNVQANENDLHESGKSGKIKLSKQEWAQYYKIIGDERHGDFVYHTQDGGRAVRLENKIVLDNGNFENPQVSNIIEFANNDLMNDTINLWIVTGDLL